VTPRTATLAGLGTGAAVAILLLVAFAAFVPPPVAVAPSASATSPGASLQASPEPSGEPSPVPTATPRSSLLVAGFKIGQAAPPLVLQQLGGGEIDLAKLAGKPVWVNFMATWCPPCRDEIPLMGGFAARYASSGLVVLAVDVKEDESAVASFMGSLGSSIPVGLDSTGAAQSTWRAAALPVHYWIDAQGIVRDGAFGGIGPDVMAAGLRTILPGVNVTP